MQQRHLALRVVAIGALSLSAGCCADNEVREAHIDLPPGWRVDGKNLVDPDGNTYGQYDGLSGDDCEAICGGSDCEIAFECEDSAAAGGGSTFTCDPGKEGDPYALQVVCTVSYPATCGGE